VGKVIVATRKEEIPRLSDIEERGRANGVALERVGASRLKEIEPHVSALEGIWIPECSVVSYAAVAQVLAAEFQKMGGELLLGQEVEAVGSKGDSIQIRTDKKEWEVSSIINCAGLYSDRIAKMALGEAAVPNRIMPFRGEYYDIVGEKANLVKGLIYPVADPRFPFLGVHLTRMINGGVEAGPNAVLATAREGYRRRDFDLKDCADFLSYKGFWKMGLKYWKAGVYEIARSLSKKMFLKDIQRLVPAIEEKDLKPGGRGIRAQVVTQEGKLLDDFSIVEEKNMIHVLNAPSPAATASFSIGREIAKRCLRSA
jgi:L-2-hydroxyglutarate oxidase LhgO